LKRAKAHMVDKSVISQKYHKPQLNNKAQTID